MIPHSTLNFRWLPVKNWYRAAETIAQARGHAPGVCLTRGGMILRTNLGTRIADINGARMKLTTERFLASGRTVHVLSGCSEPDEIVLQSAEKVRERGEIGTSSPRPVVWRVAHPLRIRDRGANEKRFLTIAAWDI